MPKKRSVTIACASAFWGDTPFAVQQLLREDKLDYLIFDYLSEVTLALLARAKKRDPATGFIPDFLTDVIEPHLREIKQRGIRIVSNAGALNPVAMKTRIEESAREKGLELKVACVTGDDLLKSPKLLPREFADRALTANAYLGAAGIIEALKQDADVVILGRAVDSALAVGPIVHELGIGWTDYDLLSQASLAGHVLECGTQATGGNFTDWEFVPMKENVGFPIVHFSEDGSFIVTKPERTGGIVNKGSVSEQITYEVGDPAAYLLPDVTCDWTEVTLEEVDENRVFVTGAKGFAPSNRYKAILTYQDGYKVSATAFIGGGDAREKASSTANAILARVRALLAERNYRALTETLTEILGGGEEALLRISAAHTDATALEILAKEIAPAATSLAPGLSSLLGGRPQVVPRIAMAPFFIDKISVGIDVVVGTSSFDVAVAGGKESSSRPGRPIEDAEPSAKIRGRFQLSEIAFARSGDKGNDVNIGVIARAPEHYPHLKAFMTPERIAKYFTDSFDSEEKPDIRVYDWPGLHAVNILMKDCLGGGGAYSLRIDPQGKSYAQRLLEMEISEAKR